MATERKARFSSKDVQNVSLHSRKTEEASSGIPPSSGPFKSLHHDNKWKPFSALSSSESVASLPSSESKHSALVSAHRQPDVVSQSSSAGFAPPVGTTVEESTPFASIPHAKPQHTPAYVEKKPGVASPDMFSSAPSVEASIKNTELYAASRGETSAKKTGESVRSSGSDDESESETEECPKDVSAAVWQFYQERVLRKKATQKVKVENDLGSFQPNFQEEQLAASKIIIPPEDSGKEEDSSWDSVNVQELLRASNEKFSRSFDQRAAKKRIAAVRRDLSRSKALRKNESSGHTSGDCELSSLDPASIVGMLLHSNSKTSEPEPAGQEKTNAAVRPASSGHQDPSVSPKSEHPTANAKSSSSFARLVIKKEAPTSPERIDSMNPGSADTPSATLPRPCIPTTPAVDKCTGSVKLVQVPSLSFANKVSPNVAHSGPSVVAPPTAWPLASTPPLEKPEPPVAVSSALSTLARPAISLSNLVSYSSDEDEDDEVESSGHPEVEPGIHSPPEDIDNVGCTSVPSPGELGEWQVLDEAAEEEDDHSPDDVLPADQENQMKEESKARENSQYSTGSPKPVYPVSMTGACPYCYSSDVVYIILCPDDRPESQLPPLMRNLLLCGCAKKLPPPTGRQCRLVKGVKQLPYKLSNR